MQHLIVMDVPGIKEYVFGTGRLVQIRGASALLDRLNRGETERYLQNKLDAANVNKIFANGGAGQFVLTGPREQVDGVLQGLKGLFHRGTSGGVSLVCGVSEYIPQDYEVCLKQAFLELKREREENPFSRTVPIHTGYLRECDTCSGMAAQQATYGEENLVLCETCYTKLEEGRERGLWADFADFLAAKGIPREQVFAWRPKDFEEIGARCQAARGYTALVYADGNAMGRLVKHISSKEQFKFFSENVDDAIREACHEALEEHCPPSAPASEAEKIPADILLLGGDDLMIYMSADRALPFALAVAEKFERKTQESFARNDFFRDMMGGRGVTVSLGVAIGKSHTPFAIMLEQAEELLRLAKAKGSTDPQAGDFYAPPCIDYHFTSSYNQLHVHDCRQSHLQLQKTSPIRLYQKPYLCSEMRTLWHSALELVNNRIPRNRLHRLGFCPSLGKMNGTLEFLHTYVRTRSEHKRIIHDALERFDCVGPEIPWKQEHDYHSTVLVDLIELTDLIP